MAGTRFYFPLTTAADVSPTPDAGWTDVTDKLVRKLIGVKGSSTITIGTRCGWTATAKNLDRQYVSEPLSAGLAFTTSLQALCYLMAREYNNQDNSITALAIQIVSRDGTTQRTRLYVAASTWGNSTELINDVTHRNASFAKGTNNYGTNYTTVAGDRLVVEIGHSDTGATPEGSVKYGENATDCVANETGVTDAAGWIEFGLTVKIFLEPVEAIADSNAANWNDVAVTDLVIVEGADATRTVTDSNAPNWNENQQLNIGCFLSDSNASNWDDAQLLEFSYIISDSNASNWNDSLLLSLNLIVIDSLSNWLDDLITYADYFGSFDDLLNNWDDLSEILFESETISLNISDSLNNWNDSLESFSSFFGILEADLNSWLDTLDKEFNYKVILNDSLESWLDSQSSFGAHYLNIIEELILTDNQDYLITYFNFFEDTLILSDELNVHYVAILLQAISLDQLLLSDNIVADLQAYGGPWWTRIEHHDFSISMSYGF